MGLRSLETAQQAVPILLRHLSAYLDLAEQDFAAAKAAAAARLRAAAVMVISACFGILMLCTLVIAVTWDGDYRLLAIGILAGVFILTALAALMSLLKSRPDSFARLRREWRRDRALLQHTPVHDRNVAASERREAQHRQTERRSV